MTSEQVFRCSLVIEITTAELVVSEMRQNSQDMGKNVAFCLKTEYAYQKAELLSVLCHIYYPFF
jgi:hypothetical protein